VRLWRRLYWLVLLCPGLCLADAGEAASAKRQSWSDWFAQQAVQQNTLPPAAGTTDDGKAARMSPEERRQLRHDVRDAGRDIYPRRAPKVPAKASARAPARNVQPLQKPPALVQQTPPQPPQQTPQHRQQ